MPSPNIGIELEYPGAQHPDDIYRRRGQSTVDLQSAMGRLPDRLNARNVYDGTVGLEMVSDVINLEDAVPWYKDAIMHVEEEWGELFQPTGLMDSGSTAGLHLHLSPLTDQQARDLYEISQTSWAKVMFCSSIANDDRGAVWPVFRGGRHCRMEYNDSRYSCVNHRSPDHYEWRLPEPVDPEHLYLIVEFLERFFADTDDAIQFAQEVLDEGDERITAIKRAEAVGMDIESMPEISRDTARTDTSDFFYHVQESFHTPDIFYVQFDDGEFYQLDSSLSGEVEIQGETYSANGVIWADSLEPVTDEERRDEVQRAFQNQARENQRETEATEELKKVLKKKKGKA